MCLSRICLVMYSDCAQKTWINCSHNLKCKIIHFNCSSSFSKALYTLQSKFFVHTSMWISIITWSANAQCCYGPDTWRLTIKLCVSHFWLCYVCDCYRQYRVDMRYQTWCSLPSRNLHTYTRMHTARTHTRMSTARTHTHARTHGETTPCTLGLDRSKRE